MFKKAFAMLKSVEEAEDAVSDAFEAVCKNIEKFQGLSRGRQKALVYTYTGRPLQR